MCRNTEPNAILTKDPQLPREEVIHDDNNDNQNLKMVTRKELKEHNTPANAWCAVHGNVLDIARFKDRHPGGDLILLAAGSDATVLFETYHPRGVPEAVVRKLMIGKMADGEQFESYYDWSSEFYPVLKKRVVARLNELNLPTRSGSGSIMVKGLFILFGFFY